MPNTPKGPNPLERPVDAAMFLVDCVMAKRAIRVTMFGEKMESGPMYQLFKKVYEAELENKHSLSELAEFIGMAISELSLKLIDLALGKLEQGEKN
jgi:hypothetical protein